MIRVAVLGAYGKMGKEVVKTIIEAPDTLFVGACDIVFVGEEIEKTGVKLTDNFDQMLADSKPNVVVDFAKPFSIDNIKKINKSGAVAIIGTTGQTPEQLSEMEAITKESGVGILVAPNFAIGALLMMKFAAEASKYMPGVEIIELHHDKKLDAPSGTSIITAEMISKARDEAGVIAEQPLGSPDDLARGDQKFGIHIHSVRLPGLVAHQEVLFGGTGQLLTIKHDSLDRTSFMPGVLLAVRKANGLKSFIYGLDKIM